MKEGEIPGYISGMLADEGHFDEMLGVPDHPRFKEGEEEEEEETTSKPGILHLLEFFSIVFYTVPRTRTL